MTDQKIIEKEFIKTIGEPMCDCYVTEYPDKDQTQGWGCGYIRIPRGHPFFQKEKDVINNQISFPGDGVTFAKMEDGYWVVGFHTSWGYFNPSYDRKFVETETKRIATEIHKII